MEEEGVIIIHTEHLTDEQRDEVLNAIMELLNDKFHHYGFIGAMADKECND